MKYNGEMMHFGVLDLTNCVVTGAQEYGMACESDPTINTCDATFEGTLGALDSCSGACEDT